MIFYEDNKSNYLLKVKFINLFVLFYKKEAYKSKPHIYSICLLIYLTTTLIVIIILFFVIICVAVAMVAGISIHIISVSQFHIGVDFNFTT